MTKLSFTVRRRQPVLIGPAVATPRETKRLSDIDDQEVLRMHVPLIFFYRGGGLHDRGDPVAVIRRALGEALVPYYPLAGRLREVEGRKLVVDCTGEGVLFVEGDADVQLQEMEAASGLRAPFPCMDELLFDDQGYRDVINCPLLLIQVTRLLCGGFVLAVRLNHTICDATGLAQFMSAVAELARGLPTPTVTPAWSREILEARCPPKPSFHHREFDDVPMKLSFPAGEIVIRTFNFRPADVTAIKNGLPLRVRNTATTFEVLTAAIWRARTAALELPPDEEIWLAVIVDIRKKLPELALPAGYYGNALSFPSVGTTAGALLAGSLADTVELVQNAKAVVTTEYVRSMLDVLVLRNRPCFALDNPYVVSDNRQAGFHRIDVGWGPPVYGGAADVVIALSYVVAVSNGDEAENVVAVPMMLPQPAMERFASEIKMLLNAVPDATTPASSPAPRAKL